MSSDLHTHTNTHERKEEKESKKTKKGRKKNENIKKKENEGKKKPKTYLENTFSRAQIFKPWEAAEAACTGAYELGTLTRP